MCINNSSKQICVVLRCCWIEHIIISLITYLFKFRNWVFCCCWCCCCFKGGHRKNCVKLCFLLVLFFRFEWIHWLAFLLGLEEAIRFESDNNTLVLAITCYMLQIIAYIARKQLKGSIHQWNQTKLARLKKASH